MPSLYRPCVRWSWGRACIGLALWLVLNTVTVPPARADSPPNDFCSGAEVIPSDGPFPYYSSVTPDVSPATTLGDPPAPSCVIGAVDHSVWYRFTPTVTALYAFSVSDDTATTVPDTVMAVYSSANGCSGPLIEVACDDDAGGLKSALSVTLAATTNYFVVVWVSAASAPITNGYGGVQLKVSRPVMPANDTCAGAEIVPGGGPFPVLTAVTDTSLASTNADPGRPSCQPAVSRSIWYRFTPAVSSTYTISTCGGDTATTVYDTVMAIYSSASECLGPFSLLACNDDSCGPRAAITTALSRGITYYIVVWESGTDPYIPGETSVQLRISGFFPPSLMTEPATSITSTGAVLSATVNPNSVATTAWFDWGTTTNYSASTPFQLLGSGSGALAVKATLGGLTNHSYFFRIHATNLLGSSFGTNLSWAWDPARPKIHVVTPVQDSPVRLQFTGAPNQLYLVQASTNLSGWSLEGPANDLRNGDFDFLDPVKIVSGFRFYRLVLP